MLDNGKERAWGWLTILVQRQNSGSVGPAFRVDFGQFYKIIQHIISYKYIYMYYNQPSMSPSWDVTNLLRPLLLPLGFKNENSMTYDIVQSRSGDYMGPLSWPIIGWRIGYVTKVTCVKGEPHKTHRW